MMYLRPQICGILSEIYSDLRDTELSSYEIFKQRVRVRCGLTADQSRKAFRELKRGPKETFSQLASKLDRLLDRWIQGSGVTSFQELKQLICVEQFYKHVPMNLRWFIKDKRLMDVAKMALILDEIEGDCPEMLIPRQWPKNRQMKPYEKGEKADRAPDKADTPVVRKISCYFCGLEGHIRSRCPQLAKKQNANTATKSVKLLTQAEEKKSPQESNPESTVSASETVANIRQVWRADQGINKDFMEPVILNNQEYLGLRDTGAEVSLVRSHCVTQDQYLKDQTFSLKGIWGPEFEVPVAEVDIVYNGVRRKWKVGVWDNIDTPILIGNDVSSLNLRFKLSLEPKPKQKGIH
nr:uncharacterized protein LOC118076980 [Zootoca vivipara]